MTPDAARFLLPDPSGQLAQLLLAATMAAAVLLALAGLGRWLGRGQRGAPPLVEPPPVRPATRPTIVAVVLALMVLPAAAGLRQLWPHPDLRWRALAVVAALLGLALLAWWRAMRREEA